MKMSRLCSNALFQVLAGRGHALSGRLSCGTSAHDQHVSLSAPLSLSLLQRGASSRVIHRRQCRAGVTWYSLPLALPSRGDAAPHHIFSPTFSLRSQAPGLTPSSQNRWEACAVSLLIPSVPGRHCDLDPGQRRVMPATTSSIALSRHQHGMVGSSRSRGCWGETNDPHR